MAHWDMTVDEENQRAYLTLAGHLSTEQHAAAADACVDAAAQLDDGFDLINDMREFEPVQEEAMAEIERGKRALAEGGMAAAVRVVSESATGQMQFDRAGDDVESYELAKAESIEQAEKLLDSR
ncbi:MAG: hypothetical protein ABEJ31_02920 [Haloarculaceae archaeon]